MPNPVTEFGYGWRHLTITTQVSVIPGILHTVVINRPDALAACTVTIYDSAAGASADIMAIIAMDSALFVIPTVLMFDSKFEHGLYVEFSAGVWTTGDITVSYG